VMISLGEKAKELGYNIEEFSVGVIAAMKVELARVASATHAEWTRLAQERLSTSRDLYLNGLRQAESFKSDKGGESYTLSLVGTMANNVEFGMESFDMKGVRPGWLGGKRAKTAKDGTKYVVIPFRHSTSASKRFSYSGKAKAAGLKKELKKVVKDYGLDRMMRAASGKVIRGAVSRVPNRAPVHKYLRGLTRVQTPTKGKTKSGGQRGSSQLISWRVMSEKSPTDSWIHTGIEAKNLLREVKAFAEKEMDLAVKHVMEAAKS